MEQAQILIPKQYGLLFKVAVEDANKGKIISIKQMGIMTSQEVSEEPLGIEAQEYVLCNIEYKSPQSLFNTGVDFGLGVLNKFNKK